MADDRAMRHVQPALVALEPQPRPRPPRDAADRDLVGDRESGEERVVARSDDHIVRGVLRAVDRLHDVAGRDGGASRARAGGARVVQGRRGGGCDRCRGRESAEEGGGSVKRPWLNRGSGPGPIGGSGRSAWATEPARTSRGGPPRR